VILENTRFGTIEVKEDKIVTMIRSMPGFPGRKRFVMLNRKESLPFLWYQSVDEPQLAFVLIDPYIFVPEYEIELNHAIDEVAWDDMNDPADLAVFVVVNTSKGDPEKMTANLIAPLLINTRRLEGFQMIIQDRPYSLRHPIFNETPSEQQ
jgi:flagellar assembly factor FliW